MINPQSLTLIQAYDPYIAAGRIMLIDGYTSGFIVQDPNGRDMVKPIFAFDHMHYEVFVYCKNFFSLEEARYALETTLWFAPKEIKCGGITDLVTSVEFGVIMGGVQGR